MSQYFTVRPLSPTTGSPPNSTHAQNRVAGDEDAEWYVEHLLDLLRTGRSPTAARGSNGWTLTYAGGVGEDEDGWIANCEYIEQAYPGLHALLDVEITFTDGPYGKKAGRIR